MVEKDNESPSVKSFSIFEDNDDKNLKIEIKKSKEILDFVDNPHKLWLHLNSNISVLFYERVIIRKQIIRLVESNEGISLEDLIDKMIDINRNSHFVKYIKKKMLKFEINELQITKQSELTLLKIIKDIFKHWFLDKCNQFVYGVNLGDEEILGDRIEEKFRKNSKIINFDSDEDKNKQEQSSEKRLDKITDVGDFF